MDAPSDDREVIHSVEMTQLCRILGVLPYEGGLYQQPWIVVEMMNMVIRMQNEREKRDQEKGKRRGA